MGGYLLLFAAGLIAGVLNVIAGGGSFLTLPILMFLGLPPGVANGTNRVGILLQNVGAVWSFERHGVLDWRSALWAAAPSIPGAALGVWLALIVSDHAFKRILALLMVTLSLWTLWSKRTGSSTDEPHGDEAPATRRWVGIGIAFFLIGIYGGFVQAGVGFLILAATTAAGLDLVRGNAVKVLTVLCFTALSLALFAWNGRVDWTMGLVLAAGTTLGGLAGARLTVLKGHRWIRGVVTVTMILFALKLWFSG
jgi:uncharacterized membrane protein YfcA